MGEEKNPVRTGQIRTLAEMVHPARVIVLRPWDDVSYLTVCLSGGDCPLSAGEAKFHFGVCQLWNFRSLTVETLEAGVLDGEVTEEEANVVLAAAASFMFGIGDMPNIELGSDTDTEWFREYRNRLLEEFHLLEEIDLARHERLLGFDEVGQEPITRFSKRAARKERRSMNRR